MWDHLHYVDWARLTHAYGYAREMPKILTEMVSFDEQERDRGWDNFWGAINHQGDFYDSTVAAIPFLIEALDHREIPSRPEILDYLYQRWLEAPDYGGDPLVPEPPGGIDEPTPMREDASEYETQLEDSDFEFEDSDDFDTSSYRSMDLCAWQTARAIQAGRPTFERLLEDPDRSIVAAAARMLLLWPETRKRAKISLIRDIESEADNVEQGKRILEFGVFADEDDLPTLEWWLDAKQPEEVRAAAAITWAWVVKPLPVTDAVVSALTDCSTPESIAFDRLPWTGIFQSGPWVLPASISFLILRLAKSNNKTVRWRAIQGPIKRHDVAKYLSDDEVIPILVDALDDPYGRIRGTAAYALSQRGESVFRHPHYLPELIDALKIHRSTPWGDNCFGLDNDANTCGHLARLLATHAYRLDSKQRYQAVKAIEKAIQHFSGKSEYINFDSLGVGAAEFLSRQLEFLKQPRELGLAEWLEALAYPNMQDSPFSPEESEARLAKVFTQDPEATIANARDFLKDETNRNRLLGTAQWLKTLGPAAESALPELDRLTKSELDTYAKDEIIKVAGFICHAMTIESDARSLHKSSTERERLPSLLTSPVSIPSDLELESWLQHDDPDIRAGAADLIARSGSPGMVSPGILQGLEALLRDEASVEVGISGPFELAGRICHWRRERKSPRASALEALFRLNHVPTGELYLQAMLAEAIQPAITTAHQTAPRRFLIDQWRRAIVAAGGNAIAEPQIRACRQRCRDLFWFGDIPATSANTELTDVIRHLSDRLI
jgi:hypothetical protein